MIAGAKKTTATNSIITAALNFRKKTIAFGIARIFSASGWLGWFLSGCTKRKYYFRERLSIHSLGACTGSAERDTPLFVSTK